MNKFHVRATDGAVPSVKFEFLDYRKIKIYTDENGMICMLMSDNKEIRFPVAANYTFKLQYYS